MDDEEIVGKVLEVLHSTREKEEKLYDGTVKSGHQFMDQVNDKQVQFYHEIVKWIRSLPRSRTIGVRGSP